MNTGAQREKGMGLIALFKMFIEPDPIEEDINEMEVSEELKVTSTHMKYLMKQYGTEPEKTKTRKSTKIRGAQLSSSSQTKNVEQKEIQEREEYQEERSL